MANTKERSGSWILLGASACRVAGNESADELAKNAFKREEIDLNVPLNKGEVKSIIKENIIKEWQEKWNTDNKGRHLYNIKKMVDTKKSISGRNRKEEVIITMRLGHSGLNASLFITGVLRLVYVRIVGRKKQVPCDI